MDKVLVEVLAKDTFVLNHYTPLSQVLEGWKPIMACSPNKDFNFLRNFHLTNPSPKMCEMVDTLALPSILIFKVPYEAMCTFNTFPGLYSIHNHISVRKVELRVIFIISIAILGLKNFLSCSNPNCSSLGPAKNSQSPPSFLQDSNLCI